MSFIFYLINLYFKSEIIQSSGWEEIHLILGKLLREYNIQETYIYKDEPCMDILATTE